MEWQNNDDKNTISQESESNQKEIIIRMEEDGEDYEELEPFGSFGIEKLFDVIKRRVDDHRSPHDIIKQYLIFDEESVSGYNFPEDLLSILSKFGFLYSGYSDDLNKMVKDMEKEIKTDAFEASINPSYDEISISPKNEKILK
ncbi:MAG: hypothetical protein PF482_01410 [Desulfobacteraceae bacterium]|jgi:hypothetical protein|nr:hypothetical protein [Desulfobacteraceae bacterium]